MAHYFFYYCCSNKLDLVGLPIKRTQSPSWPWNLYSKGTLLLITNFYKNRLFQWEQCLYHNKFHNFFHNSTYDKLWVVDKSSGFMWVQTFTTDNISYGKLWQKLWNFLWYYYFSLNILYHQVLAPFWSKLSWQSF